MRKKDFQWTDDEVIYERRLSINEWVAYREGISDGKGWKLFPVLCIHLKRGKSYDGILACKKGGSSYAYFEFYSEDKAEFGRRAVGKIKLDARNVKVLEEIDSNIRDPLSFSFRTEEDIILIVKGDNKEYKKICRRLKIMENYLHNRLEAKIDAI